MNRYEGRRVLITGGGSGIGRATVHRILAEGGLVHTVDVSDEGLAATAARAAEDGHAARLTTATLDISDENAVRDGVAAASAPSADSTSSSTRPASCAPSTPTRPPWTSGTR